jgi:hypothetical protein
VAPEHIHLHAEKDGSTEAPEGWKLRRFSTVLAHKFVYYLAGKEAALISILDDVSILAYEKARSNEY